MISKKFKGVKKSHGVSDDNYVLGLQNLLTENLVLKKRFLHQNQNFVL